MKFLFILLFIFPGLLSAQDSAKYLSGAVPVENGKVVFTRTFEAPGIPQDQLYDILIEWSKKRFTPDEKRQGRVVYSNREKGEIANRGEEYLIFSESTFSLDRSLILYQLILICSEGKCESKITSVRYKYNTSNGIENYPAEELITDENALNRKKDKLIRKIGKFRTFTIDLVEELHKGIEQSIAAVLPKTSPTSTMEPVTTQAPAFPVHPHPLQGYKQIAADQIPGNIIKMLSQDWMLITAGDKEQLNTMTASWGGLGHLYGKPVAFCFINPARYTYQFMEKEDTYTLTFYTEAYRDALQYCGTHSGKDSDKIKEAGLHPLFTAEGTPAFSEAWMIIECRKLLSQPFTPESLSDEKLRNEWSGKPMHKMYIGEILHVWIK